MKFNITLKQSLPFAQNPTICILEGDHILCNDVLFPVAIDPDASYNPSNIKAYVIGDAYRAICMVWASNEQDALDAAVNAGELDCLMDEDQDYDKQEENDLTPLGNASELFDLSNAWIGEVEWDAARDIQLIVKIVKASEGGLNCVDAWR